MMMTRMMKSWKVIIRPGDSDVTTVIPPSAASVNKAALHMLSHKNL